MDIIAKAKELGEMIADSESMQKLKSSEVCLESDQQALKLLSDYKKLQIELVNATRDKAGSEAIDNVKELLLKKQQQLDDCEVTRNYLEAKSSFDRMMKNINDVITFAITGEDQCSPDKCSSCSGCR